MANNSHTNSNNWKTNHTIDQNIRANELNCRQTIISSVSSAESSTARVRPLVEKCLTSVATDSSDNKRSEQKQNNNNNSNNNKFIEPNNKLINNSVENSESPKQLTSESSPTIATQVSQTLSQSSSQAQRSPSTSPSVTPIPPPQTQLSIAKYSSIGSNSQLTLPTITLTDVSLEIKTKSIESTLIPLVNQITTLVNARDKPIKTEKQLRAIVRVGQSVNLSVERFVAVGEAIADDNPEIRAEMCDACKDARAAGTLIEQLCDTTHDESTQLRSYADKSCMVRAARALLSSVTRVLLIADTVVVKQLISSKDRVSISLNRLENVANFTEFVKAFSQFGTEMVELAHLTGDRQNDLKDERRRAQMSCARQILERSTMMLLTSSKACLRHPDCDTARENRDTVFLQMRKAMDLIHMVIKDGVIPRLAASAATYESQSQRRTVRQGHVSRYAASAGYQTPEWKLEEWDGCITAYNAIKRFQDLVEMSRMTFVGQSTRDRLNCALDAVVERTQDFTDSAYTSHEHREKILLLCDRARLELNTLLRLGLCLEQTASTTSPSEDFEASIVQTIRASNDLKQELQDTALDQIDELFKMNSSVELVNRLKNFALAGDHNRLDEYCDHFNEYCERVQEVCRLLHHTSTTETLQVTSKHTEQSLEVYGQQLIAASQTLALHTNSKIAKENLEVFSDVWHLLCADLAQLAREVCEMVRGCQIDSSGVYLAKHQRPNQSSGGSTQLMSNIRTPTKSQSTQPFATSHVTNTMSAQQTTKTPTTSSRYSDDESKAGLKGQGSDTDMGEEAKYSSTDPEDNDIARKGKSMSTMAMAMYQFTRGEGELKTTQDLFTQAEFFADEANKLYKIVRHYTYQVPSGPPKKELLDNLDKVPTFVQQLQFAVKNVTVGKAATFTKVDNVIQETKNLMAVISKVTTNCMDCANKYNLDMQGALRARSRTLSPSLRGDTDMYYDGGCMGSKGVASTSDPDI